MTHAWNLRTQEAEAACCCEFGASLGYTLSTSPAQTVTQRRTSHMRRMNSGLVTLEKSLKIQDTGAGEVGQWLEHVGSYSQEGKGFPSSCVTVLLSYM